MRQSLLLLAIGLIVISNEEITQVEIMKPEQFCAGRSTEIQLPPGYEALAPKWLNPTTKAVESPQGRIVTLEFREQPYAIPGGIMWYGTRYRLTVNSQNKLVENQKIPLKGITSIKNHKIKEVVFLYDPDGKNRIGEER